MNLLSLRKQKGLTQKDLAEHLGISRQAYANYESGSREPDITTLKQLADFFDVSVDCLLGKSPLRKPTKHKLDLQLFTEPPSPPDNSVELINLTEQEKTLVKTFRGTTEEGRMKIIQATMNICDAVANDQLIPVFRAVRSENCNNTEDALPSQEHLENITSAPQDDESHKPS